MAAEELARNKGRVTKSCAALALPRASFYRWRGKRDAPPCPPRRARRNPRALTKSERHAVVETLHSKRFADQAPAAVWATLLDEERYLCSVRTMYRLLDVHDEVRERRNQLRHPSYAKPELLATGPNEVWSWDITKLLGPKKWTYFYLYVILDIYSRYVVGWMVAHQESAALAKRLIEETCRKQGIEPGQLTLHADRGPSMGSKSVAFLLADLGVTKTHSRPHVSNDNPYRHNPPKQSHYAAPELLATRPNELWSWDLTKLLGPAKWTYFYLYVILDVFSRYAVGWMVAHRERASLAERLIAATCTRQGIVPGQLTVHADRGSSMTSKPVALLLADLGVTKTHSRPHVSNDTPYSESQFKTLKHRSEFPDRVGSIEYARALCGDLFHWYNHEHHHVGLGLFTPPRCALRARGGEAGTTCGGAGRGVCPSSRALPPRPAEAAGAADSGVDQSAGDARADPSQAGRALTQESCMVAIVDPEASVEVGFTRNRPETPGLRPEEPCMAAVQ